MIVIATSVVRSVHKGESHGGIYLVDLQAGTHEQVVDWDRMDIDWSGRGLDRGLRGIAFYGGLTYVAASDEVLAFDRDFQIVRRHRSPYLKHCHEIDLDGQVLWLTSTGYDSLLALDLERGEFIRGLCLRPAFLPRTRIARLLAPPVRSFDPNLDPNCDSGPAPGDTLHLNMVAARGGDLYCSGTGLGWLLRIRGDRAYAGPADEDSYRAERFAKIPRKTHNVQPWKHEILMNHTSANVVRLARRDGKTVEEWPVPGYDEERLLFRDLPDDHARQRFGRGLCVVDDATFVAGSSPATVSLFERGSHRPIRSVNLSLDVRNAIHGLELYEG